MKITFRLQQGLSGVLVKGECGRFEWIGRLSKGGSWSERSERGGAEERPQQDKLSSAEQWGRARAPPFVGAELRNPCQTSHPNTSGTFPKTERTTSVHLGNSQLVYLDRKINLPGKNNDE